VPPEALDAALEDLGHLDRDGLYERMRGRVHVLGADHVREQAPGRVRLVMREEFLTVGRRPHVQLVEVLEAHHGDGFVRESEQAPAKVREIELDCAQRRLVALVPLLPASVVVLHVERAAPVLAQQTGHLEDHPAHVNVELLVLCVCWVVQGMPFSRHTHV
jgi:hypothetical protein